MHLEKTADDKIPKHLPGPGVSILFSTPACKCIQISGIMPSMFAPGTVSLTDNRAQGDDGKHCAYCT